MGVDMTDELSVEYTPGLDPDRSSVARIYDYMIGGTHNFAVDRHEAEKLQAIWPGFGATARANRAFAQRAVRYLAAEGIRQFLDLGSGIPTMGNVHEIAQAEDPAARVVYVDVEEAAVRHSRFLLRNNANATAVQADLRDPAQVLAHPEVSALLDLAEPVAVLLVAVLHFVPDEEDARRIVAGYHGAMASGSHLVISHLTADGEGGDAVRTFAASYSSASLVARDREQVLGLLDGFSLVEPGLVFTDGWRPDPDSVPDPLAAGGYTAVARRL